MQREALIGLTVILTLIALGASPGQASPAQTTAIEAVNPVATDIVRPANDAEATSGATRLQVVGAREDDRITLTMQLDVAI